MPSYIRSPGGSAEVYPKLENDTDSNPLRRNTLTQDPLILCVDTYLQVTFSLLQTSYQESGSVQQGVDQLLSASLACIPAYVRS